MYQKFKNCILKPRNIADYIKEPKKQSVSYMIVLLVIYIIPFVLISLLSNSNVTTISSSVSEDFISADEINYVIEDGKLKATTDNAVPQYIKTDLIIETYKFNALYVFDLTGDSFESVLDVENGLYILFLLTENEFKICSVEITKNNNQENNNGSGVIVSFMTSENNSNITKYISLSYEELEITNINFAGNKDANTINFRNDIATVVSAIYNNIKIKLLPIIIIVIIILAVGSYFFSVLFITLLTKILYRYLQVDFGIVFKTVILSSTPYVICSLLGLLIGISLLEIVGQFIMIAYTTKALMTYKIKYDGGIPLPRYMQNMMKDKKDDEEKGSGDDEL